MFMNTEYCCSTLDSEPLLLQLQYAKCIAIWQQNAMHDARLIGKNVSNTVKGTVLGKHAIVWSVKSCFCNKEHPKLYAEGAYVLFYQ